MIIDKSKIKIPITFSSQLDIKVLKSTTLIELQLD